MPSGEESPLPAQLVVDEKPAAVERDLSAKLAKSTAYIVAATQLEMPPTALSIFHM